MTNPYREMCAELLNDLEHSLSQHCLQGEIDNDPLIIRARALLAQPVAEGLTDQELLRCAKIATPCYDLKIWERELNMMRAAIAADRARFGRPTPQPPADGEVAELAEWLRTTGKLLHPDYSKSQIPYMRAADLLGRSTPQPVAVSEHPWERDGWCDEQGRCWWTANKPGPLPPSWWMVSIPQSCTDGIMLPANALPTPEATNE